jgi:hypothetical protein
LWKFFKSLGILIVFIAGLLAVSWWGSLKPSLLRDWASDQKILPNVVFSGNVIRVENVRDFRYRSTSDYDVRYVSETYDLDAIDSLYFVIEPFSEFDGPAHTMLSFGFSDGKYVSVSPEIRKEKGESFSPVSGILNSFEIAYMVGTENDLVKLRTNFRKDDVFLYPIRATKTQIRDMFTSAMHRTDKLSKEPEFYHTLWNNCVTNIRSHANSLRDEKIPVSIELLLPSHSDQVIYDFGLIDTSLPIEEAREYYRINPLAEQSGEGMDFSRAIRKGRK